MTFNKMIAALFALFLVLSVQAQQVDSLQIYNMDEIEVISTRATSTTPVAFVSLSKEQIKKQNLGQDLPYLLNMTPSVVTTSDAGTGIGYTSMRIRGTDATRINVTANGIPMNDAESHSVFWVNMPDFASSVKDVQVQRGAGTSTNGAGAFGASINMQTGDLSMKPYAEFSGSYGSFQTHKETFKVGTGLIKEHWAFDARLSNIATNGYIDRASASLNAYYLQGAYYANNTSIKLITFAGREETYHAWNYASREEMDLYGRRYNSCGYMYTDDQGISHYYNDQTDNYVQKNYHLLVNHQFNASWSLNAGLHYTKGDGYYQEYKDKRTLIEYGLKPFEQAGSEVFTANLIRRKAMDNHFGGGIFSVSYNSNRLKATLGGGINRYEGDHFGQVLWVENYIGPLHPNQEYYRNQGTKNDANIYLKGDYELTKGLNIYGDLQYRHLQYKIAGVNDKWNYSTEALQELNINDTFDFLNPKAGISWQINTNQRLFGSFSVAHKEPTRNNYTDGKLTDSPRAERMFDYELGYSYGNKWLSAGVNLYYMDYKDQLVLTGELNEIGEPIAANMPKSYRTGVELMAGVKLPCGFAWDVNATFSKNRIKNFTELLYEDGWNNPIEVKLGDTPIAFSPSIIVNNRLSYSYKGLEAALQSNYVSKQYMSNAQQEEHLLDAYFVSNLSLAYTFKLPYTKQITVGCTLYNLFNETYENNGYAGSGYYVDGGEKIRYNYAGYAAQAGINALGHITILF
ncbi:MAG: TonB-dependent receptor [Phocaeicola sp.]